ncbi:MAG: hypothetical protein HQM10_22460 [Candidatus Riflebacteria bacterium]|nr:hypothetical protein [Candidatus Riflebacteria bacterium]
MKNIDSKRIFITGISAITPFGNGLDAIFEAIKSGKTAYGQIEHIDVSTWPVKAGGFIPDLNPGSQGLFDRKLKNMPKYVRLGVASADAAFKNARLDEKPVSADRLGAFVATGANGNNAEGLFPAFSQSKAEDNSLDLSRFAHEGLDQIHPLWLLATISNNLIFFVTHFFRALGANSNYCNSAIAGASAIDKAVESLLLDEIDAAIVGGVDCTVNWQMFSDMAALGILAEGDVSKVCPLRPFSETSPGSILSDAGCFMIIETEESCIRRGITPIAVVRKTAFERLSTDHFKPSPDGMETENVLKKLLAEVNPESVIQINANGIGVPSWDAPEKKGLLEALENRNYSISSAKSWVGNTHSVSFALETAMSAWSLYKQLGIGFSDLKNRSELSDWSNATTETLNHDFAVNLGQCFGGSTAGVLLSVV